MTITRLHDWLTTQADRRPEACAVVFGEQTTSYGEIHQASNRLARALREAGCIRGDRVAMLLSKSPHALTAMFGAQKGDCIYLPLDTSSPASRIARILQRADCSILLAERATASLLSEIIENRELPSGVRIGWVDRGAELDDDVDVRFTGKDVRSLPSDDVLSVSRSSDPVHILFTSGTTGIPKGVVITHSSVIHFVQWAVSCFGMNAEDRISGHPPLHFDLSTFDVYGTFAAGARIHLVPPELSVLPYLLAEFIRKSELTQWFSVPSVLHLMAKLDVVHQNDFPTLRRLLWCGEKFPTPSLIYWKRRLPDVAFANLYGPTEATIASSCYCVRQCPVDEKSEIPIGQPCDGESLLILDEDLRKVAPGEIGDLYIGGVGLSPGYWRDPDKTKEVFLPDPYSANASDRIYKTGDLARTGDDGEIYLLGRSDSQIKSRGYRIELGEIEAAVHSVPRIQDAVVVALDSPGAEGKEICCAYVPCAGAEIPPSSMKLALSQILPRYMIPARWMVLESLPHNGNGKADRPLLRERFARETSPGGGEAPPIGHQAARVPAPESVIPAPEVR